MYRDFERLELKGVLPSSMLSSKPFTRLEGLRILNEAEDNLKSLPEGKSREPKRIINWLRKALWDEVNKTGAVIVKPAEELYARILYSVEDPYFSNINNNGDILKEGFNLRTGVGLKAEFFDTISFYANPEYRFDKSSETDLVLGYALFDVLGMEVQAGKDTMWWGSGYHGDLLITNNAAPFDMVKVSTQRPILLPWIFNYLGFFKPTFFLAHLEDNRDFPRTNLFGMRLDVKPTPRFQIGFNRVFMFGGEGRESLTASDWLSVFIATDSAEHTSSAIDGNQIASIDASYIYVNDRDYIPLSGVKLYAEIGAEDSSGDTKSPTAKAYLFGILIDEPFWFEGLDLRVEWASTARSDRPGDSAWYRHPIYTTGYTFNGNIIGHHMGSDSRDLYTRLQYQVASGATIAVDADFEHKGVHSIDEKKNWVGIDADYLFTDYLSISGGAGMERDYSSSNAKEINKVFWLNTSFTF